MNIIAYLKLLGAKACIERNRLGLKSELPLVVIDNGIVIDCDEGAWKQGVRCGDTLRQVRITSPLSQIVRDPKRVFGLESVLKELSEFTPFIEQDKEANGVFISLFKDTSIKQILHSLDGMAFQIFVGLSSSKLISKAASNWLFYEFEKNSKTKFKGVKWVTVTQEEKYRVASVNNEREFISNLPLDYIWMLPKDIVSILKELGIKNARDLNKVPLTQLEKQIGNWALLAKEWSCGKDFSRVSQVYPPPRIVKKIDIQAAVYQIDEKLLQPKLHEISEYLFEKSLGLKKLTLTLSGTFSNISRCKVFTRPVCSEEVISVASASMLKSIATDLLSKSPACPVSTVTLIAQDFEPIYLKQKDLWSQSRQKRPVELGLTLMNVRKKFGHEALSWGREKEVNLGIARREKMLAVWDPMRAG